MVQSSLLSTKGSWALIKDWVAPTGIDLDQCISCSPSLRGKAVAGAGGKVGPMCPPLTPSAGRISVLISHTPAIQGKRKLPRLSFRSCIDLDQYRQLDLRADVAQASISFGEGRLSSGASASS